MIVSWNWLTDYVALDMPPAELVDRLAMAGLNHESTEPAGEDLAIDVEVTSNRPDCLGHLGVAREIAVLYEKPLQIPAPDLPAGGVDVHQLARVSIRCHDLCPRYTARMIRGVKVGPSPKWLVDRLAAVGVPSINNVVDVTNYVMLENGQPLHAFDLARLAGAEIIVRRSLPGEQFLAINHKTYELDAGTCVISDAQQAVALGGVMGGADTEVSETTVDVLIEAAEFAPLSIRTTARKLALQSPSSYRFERGVDPLGVDWASRRCCQLILQLAGGELAAGVIAVGQSIPERDPIELRLAQLPRVLGIEIPAERVRRILADLGCRERTGLPKKGDNPHFPERPEGDSAPVGPVPSFPAAERITVVPPTWRRDLTREIDLVEEVARIHGYGAIPEDAAVPMVPSHRSALDRVQEKVRQVLIAAGFDEAMTSSVVTRELSDAFSPWSDAPALRTIAPMLKGADHLRCSLVSSLLEVRRGNQALGNWPIELFEVARVYLPQPEGLPREQLTLGLTSGGDYYALKGVLETLLAALNPTLRLDAVDTRQPLLDATKSCQLQAAGRRLGWLGEVAPAALKQFGLRAAASVAELDLSALAEIACLIPQHTDQSPYPAIERDLNLIVAETVRWAELSATVRQAAGRCLESLRYQETYRDPERDGAGQKRLLLSISLRSSDRTLTNEEADQIRQAVVDACAKTHAAVLLGS